MHVIQDDLSDPAKAVNSFNGHVDVVCDVGMSAQLTECLPVCDFKACMHGSIGRICLRPNYCGLYDVAGYDLTCREGEGGGAL